MTLTSTADSVLSAIGGTPVVRLRRVVSAADAAVLVKLESVNPTGSYKDRMALAMIEGAEARGLLRSGMRVVEFTGGSTGSSLAMVCAAKGYRFVVLSSDAFAREKLLTMEALGAELRMVPSDGGKVTPALFERFKKEIAVLASEPNTFWTDQFHNEDAVRGYMGIGHELLQQAGGAIDVFCGAVGTGGMLRGVSRALRDAGSHARIVALEPSSSPALTEGRGGAHRVEGIGTGSVPPHMADRPYDEARSVDEADARAMAKQLAREEGLLVGTSSGLNIAAALQLARELGPGKTVATVAVDTGLKYLAGDLYAGQAGGSHMKTIIVVVVAAAVLSGPVGAQEKKPVPKDSVRVSVPGCSKGFVFTAGRRTEDQPGPPIPEGMHLRMSGPKTLMAEIKGQEGSMIEITGLMKKGQPGEGVALGRGVRITGGASPTAGGGVPSPGGGQIMIDVEGWRRILGDCPSR